MSRRAGLCDPLCLCVSVLGFLSLLQAADPARLVDALRSDVIEEREEAARKLREIGAPAAPALEKAARDPDTEVAVRARLLLRLIELRRTLPPRLLAALPGVEDRLASDDDRAWTRAFLDAAEARTPRGRLAVGNADLLPLLPAALLGRLVEERQAVVNIVRNREIRGASRALLPLLADPELENHAIRAFRDLGGPEIVPDLLALVRHGPEGVRRAACEALQLLDATQGWRELASLLRNPDPKRRAEAASLLGAFRASEAVPALEAALSDPDAKVRDEAAGALGALKSSSSVPALVPLLRDPDPGARLAALAALRNIPAPEAADRLAPLLSDEPRIRAYAAATLGEFGHAPSVPVLVPLLRDPEARVRHNAAEALRLLDARDRAGEVLPLLADPDADVREQAAFALGRFGSAAAEPALTRLLKDEDRDVRAAAAEALGRIGAGEVRDLLPLLKDPDIDTRGAAAAAIRRRGAGPLVADLVRLVADEDDTALKSAGQILHSLATPEVVDAVAPLLADPRPEVRRAALETLTRHRRVKTPEGLEKLLTHAEPGVRDYAVTALARLRGEAALPLLLPMLKDPTPEVRRSVLMELKDPGLLVAALSDPDPEVRLTAFRRLYRLDPLRLIPALPGLLKDPGAEVRHHILDAIYEKPLAAVAPVLFDLLGDADSRNLAERILRRMEVPDLAPRAVPLLADPKPERRMLGLDLLVAWLKKAAAPHVSPALEDADADVRANAAWAAGETGLRSAVPRLLALLEESPQHVLTALAKLEAAAPVPALLKLLDDPEKAVRQAAAAALGRQKAVEAGSALLAAYRADRSYEIAYSLAGLGLREALPLLLADGQTNALNKLAGPEDLASIRAQLRDPDRAKRSAALRALSALDDAGAVEGIAALLADPVAALRVEAARALVGMKRRERLPSIAALGADPDDGARRAAVAAIVAMEGSEQAPVLRRLLRDRDPGVREAAADAVYELGIREAAPDLLPLLRDPNGGARVSAAYGLGELEAGQTVDALREAFARPDTSTVKTCLALSLAKLGVTAAADDLVRFMEDPDCQSRDTLSCSLVLLGDRRGIPGVMDDPYYWHSLNALRRPELWRRLGGIRLTRTYEGKCIEVLEALAKEAGLGFERPKNPGPEARDWMDRRVDIRARGGLRSVRHAIVTLDDRKAGFVLEDDRIRIHAGEEARAFWSAWWDAESKKGK